MTTRLVTLWGRPIVCKKSTMNSLGPVITIAPVLKHPSATCSGTRARSAAFSAGCWGEGPPGGDGSEGGGGVSEFMRLVAIGGMEVVVGSVAWWLYSKS